MSAEVDFDCSVRFLMYSRVSCTDSAASLIEKLTLQYGKIIFLQSGGCCEGSGPLSMPENEFRRVPSDVKVGEVAGADFYMGHSHFEFAQNMHTILDAIEASSGSFSLDCGTGWSFITRTRLFSVEESNNLLPIERFDKSV